MTEDASNVIVVEEVQAEGWNYRYLYCALVFGFMLQSMFLSCACNRGSIRMMAAFGFDGLMVLRIIVVKLLKQKDKGWIFYMILIYSSPVWIRLLAAVLIGGH
jgi:hypothetical protein